MSGQAWPSWCPDCGHSANAHAAECTLPSCGCDRSRDEFAAVSEGRVVSGQVEALADSCRNCGLPIARTYDGTRWLHVDEYGGYALCIRGRAGTVAQPEARR